MDVKTKTVADAIKQLAQDDEDIRYREYSGRGMYGKECVGVRTDYPNATLADIVEETGYADLIRSHRVDSMGLSYILYFPGLLLPESESE